MGILGGSLARALLSRFNWKDVVSPTAYQHKSKLEVLLGDDIWSFLDGKSVVDYGCGRGSEALEIGSRCPRTDVIGLDINESQVQLARRHAQQSGLSSRCFFTTSVPRVSADVILSVDAFEHYSDPGAILRQMDRLLGPEGRILISFGPPWYHPKGSHFPGPLWANLLFTEKALMEWRSHFKDDGATHFEEVRGGLNRMTIHKFKDVVASSGFELESLELVPIRRTGWLHSRLTQEFLTSTVRAVLRRPAKAPASPERDRPREAAKSLAAAG